MDNLLVKRVLATLLDVVLVSIPTAIIYGLLFLLKLNPVVKEFIDQFSLSSQISFVFMIVYAIYDIVYTMKFRTTIGKKRFNIHIETLKGRRRIPTKRLWLRSILKSISLFTLYSVPAVISVLMMTNDYGTSLHDKIARTSVWENIDG